MRNVDLDPVDGNAGRPCCLVVSTHCIDAAPEDGLVQNDRCRRDNDEDDDDRILNAKQTIDGDVVEAVRQIRDRPAIRYHQRCAARDRHHAECHDEGRDLALCDHHPIDQADDGPTTESDSKANREGKRLVLHRHGRQYPGDSDI